MRARQSFSIRAFLTGSVSSCARASTSLDVSEICFLSLDTPTSVFHFLRHFLQPTPKRKPCLQLLIFCLRVVCASGFRIAKFVLLASFIFSEINARTQPPRLSECPYPSLHDQYTFHILITKRSKSFIWVPPQISTLTKAGKADL
jgi:hypothetical protein